MTYPLLTKRLSIQPLALTDVIPFLHYRQDPDIARFQSWDPSYSQSQALELITSQAGVVFPAKGDWLQLALHNLLSGDLVGDLAIHSLADQNASFEIGFTIAKPHQGLGYAKEAVFRLLSFLFQDKAASKVIATTDTRNESSIRVLSALGFEKKPQKSWSEEFKNELVVVDYYELTRDSFSNRSTF